MPKGKYQRKQRAMQPDMTGAAEAASEPIADTVPDFEGTVLALLSKMSESIQGLSARVEAVESAAPQFIPQTVDSLSGAGDRSRTALAAEPDGIPHSQKIPMFPNGETVPQMVMEQYRPRFGTDSRVRINLDVVPHGRSDGKTRRELKLADGTPDGIGEIIDRTFLSMKGEWKYRVKFPPKTLPGSNGGITALYERELMPA